MRVASFAFGVSVSALLVSYANAALVTTGSYSGWTSLQGLNQRNQRECAIVEQNNNFSKALIIRAKQGNKYFTVEMYKKSWLIPQGVHSSVTFDISGTRWAGPAYTYNKNAIAVKLSRHTLVKFVVSFARGTSMVIYFDDGSEAPWTASLSGSTEAISAMLLCIKNYMYAPTTEPYSSGVQSGTEPFRQPGTPPSQPSPPGAVSPRPVPEQGSTPEYSHVSWLSKVGLILRSADGVFPEPALPDAAFGFGGAGFAGFDGAGSRL
jgi:hypothetical protein